MDITQSIINRLYYLDKNGEGIEATINALCEYAENTPYEFFKLPVSSRPRHRKLGSIPIGKSVKYEVPAIDVDNFISSTHTYGYINKMRFQIDWLPECLTVQTATVTRIA